MEKFTFSALNPTQCRIREKINCCERYTACRNRSCKCDPSKLSNATLLDILDFIDEATAEGCSEKTAFVISEYTDAARNMVIESVAKMGTGISIAWPPEK